MLTVVTGLPGSGKTSGVVERFLMPMAAKDWDESAITSDGEKVTIKRKLFTNINGLLLEHELIDAAQLMNWQDWVKPGDLIVFDEVQKPWPLTGANKEQPKCITELETHRHYGIDMILLTQHPMLINAAIVRLAGQHLHVRKLGNSRFATIYEWDGVSRTLLYKNAFAKTAWRRGKACEKIYRSSSLHTKQKRAIPTVLFVIALCLILFPLGVWKFGSDFKQRYFGGPVVAKTAPIQPGESKPGELLGSLALPGGISPAPPFPSAPPVVSSTPPPVFAGCARIRNRCQCFDVQGTPVDKDKLLCEDTTRVAVNHGDVLKNIRGDGGFWNEETRRAAYAENDATVLAMMAGRQAKR